MTKTYILLDFMNLFWRCKHANRGDTNLKVGMALHTIIASIRKMWIEFAKDHTNSHVIVCNEGRSWRKDVYEPYKRNRAAVRAVMTQKELDEDAAFIEAFNEFKQFITEQTNCTVLQHPRLEADDLIAGWIQNHPNDQHIIISTDSDFVQLIAPNVRQYNGVNDQLITDYGIFDGRGNPVKNKKTKLPEPAPDPRWLLFEKIVRGDVSDNVFSAYPGVRTKGTKNRVGLREAFDDRNSKGYFYNNFMLQKWTDHNGQEHRVLEDFARNRTLIDLTAQPDDIKQIINNTIAEQAVAKNISQVGIRLLKFCSSYDLKRIADNIAQYAAPFQANFPG